MSSIFLYYTIIKYQIFGLLNINTPSIIITKILNKIAFLYQKPRRFLNSQPPSLFSIINIIQKITINNLAIKRHSYIHTSHLILTKILQKLTIFKPSLISHHNTNSPLTILSRISQKFAIIYLRKIRKLNIYSTTMNFSLIFKKMAISKYNI